MTALRVNHRALERGGVLVRMSGYRGRRSELRLAVRIEDGGRRRKYDIREWYDPGTGEWLPGRHGISGLAGSDLRALLRLLQAGAVVIPSRGSSRVANSGAA